MSRLDDLKEIFEKVDKDRRDLAEPMIYNAEFLEKKLMYLRTLPFIRVHPDDPTLQKRTEASKQYKELMQSYTNIIKVLNSILQKNAIEDEDEFDAFEREFG